MTLHSPSKEDVAYYVYFFKDRTFSATISAVTCPDCNYEEIALLLIREIKDFEHHHMPYLKESQESFHAHPVIAEDFKAWSQSILEKHAKESDCGYTNRKVQ